MLAKYKGRIYAYVSNSTNKVITTRQKGKADTDFKKDRDDFYKEVNEEDITDVFEVRYWAAYDAGLPDTPSLWIVQEEAGGIEKERIQLMFCNGILPGWEIEEKNVCTKFVEITEIKSTIVEYLYRKKDGKTLDSILREKIEVPVEKMIELCLQYKIKMV